MRGGSAGVGGGYRQTPYSGGIATGRGGRGGGGGGRGGGQRGGYQINCHDKSIIAPNLASELTGSTPGKTVSLLCIQIFMFFTTVRAMCDFVDINLTTNLLIF